MSDAPWPDAVIEAGAMASYYDDPQNEASGWDWATLNDELKAEWRDEVRTVLTAAFAVRDDEGLLLLRRSDLEQVAWQWLDPGYGPDGGLLPLNAIKSGDSRMHPVFRLRHREGEGET